MRAIFALLASLTIGSLAPAQDAAPGLLVRLYEVGEDMRWLPELVSGQQPNAVKVVPTLDLNTERKDFDDLEDNFLAEVVGTIKIEHAGEYTFCEAGEYTFRLISDDGAQLWLDGRLVVDNDGAHPATPKDGEIDLPPGQHELKIWYFQAGGEGRLTLQWRLPDPTTGCAPDDCGSPPVDAFQLIPPALLSHPAGALSATAPGRKKIIPALRKGRPGDGTPVAGVHPSFDWSPLRRPTAQQIGALRAAMGLNACADDYGYVFGAFRTEKLTDGAQIRRLPGRPAPVGGELLAWLPPNTGSEQPSIPGVARGGPYGGQLFVGDSGTNEIKRVFYEKVARHVQGCVFRFSVAGCFGPSTFALAGGTDGSILDSFFSISDDGNGPPICILQRNGRMTFELLAVRALGNGLELEFTKPLDPRLGWDRDAYLIEQWPYYASKGIRRPVRDGRSVPVKSASVSADRCRVVLEIDGLQSSRVVYVRLLPPCWSEDGELPWTTEAWYTLEEIPKDRIGKVLPAPAKAPQNFLTEEEQQAGWRLLFDGETTKGWHGYKKASFPGGWRVTDDCLVRVAPAGDIITDDAFGDFELSLEWRISAGGNSGIMYRVTEDHDYPWQTGPEYQILDNAEHADGKNPLTSASSCCALYAPVKDVTVLVGLFNHTRIVVQGDHVEHWLNGVKMVEYELGSPEWEKLVADSKFGKMPDYGRRPKGKIALQDHGDKVWHRNIKIREIEREVRSWKSGVMMEDADHSGFQTLRGRVAGRCAH